MSASQETPAGVRIERPGYPPLEVAFLGDLSRFRDADPWTPLVVLVPSRSLLRRLRERVALTPRAGFLLRFHLFPGLAGEILRSAGEAETEPAELSSLLLTRAVAEPLAAADRSRFRTVADRTGFHESLRQTFEDLDEAGFQDGAGLPASLAEIPRLHQEWRRLLKAAGAVTTAQRLERAALSAAGWAPGTPVWVYGFYDLTGNQRRLLRTLLPGRQMRVYFPAFSGAAATFAESTRGWLEESGFRLGGTDGGGPDFDPAGSPLSREKLRWFSAPGERAEVEEVARRIRALLLSGVSPAAITLRFRSTAPYARHAREVFERAGIAARFAEALPLAETRPGRGVRSFLEIVRGDRTRRDLLDFLDLALADTRPADMALFDELTREAGVTRGEAAWRDRLEYLAARRDDRREGVARLGESIEMIWRRTRDVESATGWAAAASALRAMLGDWFAGDPDIDAVGDALVRLEALDSTLRPFDAGALSWLVTKLLSRGRREIDDGAERVEVGDLNDARGLRYEHLFLVGVTERVFPHPAGQDPILLDLDRSRLADRAVRLPLRRARLDEERLLFEMALGLAPNRTLSWSRLDPANGRPRIASSFLLEAAGRALGRPIDFKALEEAGDAVRLNDRTVEPLDRAGFEQRELARAIESRDLLRGAFLRNDPAFDRLMTANEARWSTRFTPWDGALADPRSLEIVAREWPKDHTWSATLLQTCAGCPMRVYLQTLLGLEEPEELDETERLSARDRGDLAHTILRDFFLGRGGFPTDVSGWKRAHADLEALTREHLGRFSRRSPTGHRLLWAIDGDRLAADLADWLDYEERRLVADPAQRLQPTGLEVRFGGEPRQQGRYEDPALSTAKPVGLELPDGGVAHFFGYIDRIDREASGTCGRIVDYKAGKLRDREGADLKGGRRLQLAIYRLALQSILPEMGSADAEYLYFFPALKSLVLSDADFGFSRSSLSRQVEALIRILRAGFFPAWDTEVEGGRCNCHFPTLCGAQRAEQFELKRGDPRTAWLDELDRDDPPSAAGRVESGTGDE